MTDKKSGRIFYYNKVTKKTQWTKPNEDSKMKVVWKSYIKKFTHKMKNAQP